MWDFLMYAILQFNENSSMFCKAAKTISCPKMSLKLIVSLCVCVSAC